MKPLLSLPFLLHALAISGGVLLAAAGCVEDPTLERKGGPPPPPPVSDGSGGTGETGAAGAGGAEEPPVPFCVALTVVRDKCQRCHNDPTVNGAPVPLLEYEDFHEQYYATDLEWWNVAASAVRRDFMPYVTLNGRPELEGGPVEPLTPDEKATLLGWLDQGALPEGGTTCP